MEIPTFEELVREEGAFIRRTLASLGVPANDVADVAQEVLRGAERGLPSFDPSLAACPEGAVRAWLFRICERQAAHHRRKQRCRAEVTCDPEEIERAGSSSPSAEERWIELERRALLSDLLESLAPERRALVVGYELEGIPMADLAFDLEIPVNTAWNRLRLARGDLRVAWLRHPGNRGRGAR